MAKEKSYSMASTDREEKENSMAGMDGEEKERPLTIDTPWEELEARFQAIFQAESRCEDEVELYSSVLKQRGRPILPPVMDQHRRDECRRWRQRALRVETSLKNRWLEREEDSSTTPCWSSSSTEEEEELVTSVASHRKVAEVDAKAWSNTNEGQQEASKAFKDLVHKLRASVGVAAVTNDLCASTLSVATVIENPKFKGTENTAASPVWASEAMDNVTNEKDDATVFRSRSGSYTLAEPSPLLKAYMAKYGHRDMSHGQAERLKPNAKDALNDYLSNVSAMPELCPGLSRSVPVWNDQLDQHDKGVDPGDSNCETEGDVNTCEETSKPPASDEKQAANEAVETYAVKESDAGRQDELLARESCPSAQLDLSLAQSVTISLPPGTSDGPSQMATPVPTTVSTTPRPLGSAPSTSIREPHPPDGQIQSGQLTVDKPLQKEDQENQAKGSQPLLRPVNDQKDVVLSQLVTMAVSPSRPGTSSSRRIEEAVSVLAQEQQRRIKQLEHEQQRQRKSLEETFRRQQRELIAEILSNMAAAGAAPPPFDPPPRSASPPVPARAASTRPPAPPLPADWRLPPAVDDNPKVQAGLVKLTALARGHLVRRLMRTRRVQGVIGSLRDTMSAALQLHRESSVETQVTQQDVELHRRLLQQINRDCLDMHHIFFDLSTPERMRIIALDHEANKATSASAPKSPSDKQRRLSSVTLAKLEERQLRQKAENSSRPRSAGGKENRMRSRSSIGHGVRKPFLSSRGTRARRSLYNLTANSYEAREASADTATKDSVGVGSTTFKSSSAVTSKIPRSSFPTKKKAPWK